MENEQDTFTLWNKPDSGPLIVQERDATGRFWVWHTDADANARARELKSLFPHMDFVVCKEARSGVVSIAFDTSRQEGVR